MCIPVKIGCFVFDFCRYLFLDISDIISKISRIIWTFFSSVERSGVAWHCPHYSRDDHRHEFGVRH